VHPRDREDEDAGMNSREDLLRMYELLDKHFGDLHWWPADGPFEVMVGAILTQNTAWTNVEKAIAALKARDILSLEELSRIDEGSLSAVIRSAGCYRVKAKRIKTLVAFLQQEYAGNIETMSQETLPALRDKLLGVTGVGQETADSILLYACGKAVFISDAYTQRILQRHNLIAANSDSNQVRALFMDHLPQDVSLFKQFHALLVCTGKFFCRKIPKCDTCPLRELLTAPNPA
jgi:endonuclease-3 related protein